MKNVSFLILMVVFSVSLFGKNLDTKQKEELEETICLYTKSLNLTDAQVDSLQIIFASRIQFRDELLELTPPSEEWLKKQQDILKLDQRFFTLLTEDQKELHKQLSDLNVKVKKAE